MTKWQREIEAAIQDYKDGLAQELAEYRRVAKIQRQWNRGMRDYLLGKVGKGNQDYRMGVQEAMQIRAKAALQG